MFAVYSKDRFSYFHWTLDVIVGGWGLRPAHGFEEMSRESAEKLASMIHGATVVPVSPTPAKAVVVEEESEYW